MAAYGESCSAGSFPGVLPVPDRAIFRDPDFYIWGASMVCDPDGGCHLYYSRWPRSLGHNAWVTHSEIAHAVAEDPLGPYRHADVALPVRGAAYWDGLCTHNPTGHRFGGRYYLYYMGNTGDGRATEGLNWVHRNNQRIGVAVADRPEGPWQRFDAPVLDVSPERGAPDALMVSNPSVCRGAGGTFLMVYKGVGLQREMPFGGPVVHCVATAESPTGPFRKHGEPIFTAGEALFPAEDPYVWFDGETYRAVVKDQGGYFTGVEGRSLALFESPDGIHWGPSAPCLLTRTQITREDGSVQALLSLERPQLAFREGRPAVLFCAADVTREHSFNVAIPLGD